MFCKIDKGEIPTEKVYDKDGVFAIKDINPQAPIHFLIIPKKHFSTILIETLINTAKKSDEQTLYAYISKNHFV